MEYITFREDYTDFKVAILAANLDFNGMAKAYLHNGLVSQGASVDIAKELIAYKLPMVKKGTGYRAKSKPLKVAERREFFGELLENLKDLGIKHIIVTEPNYYKTLTGGTQSAQEVGTLKTVDPSHFNSYLADFKVTYCPNHKMVFYDPVKTTKNIHMAMKAVVDDMSGSYTRPGEGIIKACWYPQGVSEIAMALQMLLQMDVPLTADIEGFSLSMHDAGIGTIAFAWNQHKGLAFQVDIAPGIPNHPVRELLANFFMQAALVKSNEIKFIWHQASYDVTNLTYQLGTTVPGVEMENVFDWLTDQKRIDCTKIISYLATNSCAGNKLSLKDQALEFAGNYAITEIKDITLSELKPLLKYNLIDALSTWFTYNKNYPIMVRDDQLEIYTDIFKPSLVDVVDMQLTGLPVDKEQVAIAKADLQDFSDNARQRMESSQIVIDFKYYLNRSLVEKKNAEYKKKRITMADVDEQFNPGSSQQLQILLFDPSYMGLPILSKTPSGAASTKGKELAQLKNHTQDQGIIDFLDALIDYKDAAILLSTFIPALENARLGADGNYYMHGSFNLGGTVSGRLSSSDPNLQNMPAKSRLSKYIKMCIKAPDGWILVGLDYDSLEDKISALQTKDPNKLKVYTDGYDGHCLRAHSYFGHMMPDIDPNCVTSINSIADLYPKERQDSKAPTFLLTYDGTYHGLIANCGFSEEVAKGIESNYHALYVVSDEWKKTRIDQATKDGYVTVAFGLRVRTPILHQVILGNKKTPSAAKAEARTAGNAMGQSWGLLNNRSCSEFMQKVRSIPYRRKNIRVCCQIHDAQYYLIKDDVEQLEWFNLNIVEAVKWQDHPEIAHPDVKLSGKTSIFYPNWAHEHMLPNGATQEQIIEICAGIGEKFAA